MIIKCEDNSQFYRLFPNIIHFGLLQYHTVKDCISGCLDICDYTNGIKIDIHKDWNCANQNRRIKETQQEMFESEFGAHKFHDAMKSRPCLF